MMATDGNTAGGRAPTMGAPGLLWLALIGLSVGAQWAAMILLPADGAMTIVRRVLVAATTVLAIAAAVQFRRMLGAWLIAAGITLNLLPILANGGLMPVAWETVRDSGEFPQITAAQVGGHIPRSKDVLLPREDIRLESLSDRFVLDAPLLKTHIYSAGDLVLFAGIALAIIEIVAWVATGTFPATRLRGRQVAPESV